MALTKTDKEEIERLANKVAKEKFKELEEKQKENVAEVISKLFRFLYINKSTWKDFAK